MTIQALINAVRKWGADKGLIGPEGKATLDSQMDKLDEEFIELDKAITQEDQASIIDGIGDMAVVLTLLAERAGTSLEKCLAAAYVERQEEVNV